MYQPRVMSSVEATSKPTKAGSAMPPCTCDGEVGSGSDGHAPSRSPIASVKANPQAFGGASPTRKSVEANGAAAPIKRKKASRARRILPIIAKVEKIGSPETLVYL
ncbi:hypothetical protein CSPX01_03167 [Colletotrichum filicis]|nr:hypothetical protein CSPX01_03167 [Colletotrichum filicis]